MLLYCTIEGWEEEEEEEGFPEGEMGKRRVACTELPKKVCFIPAWGDRPLRMFEN